jgi:putative transposase
MARLGRYFLPDLPQHLIQRGNNRAAIFFDDEDRRFFLDALAEAAAAEGCALHAYVLMTNHIHLLATPRTPRSIPCMLQRVGRRYVRRINWRTGRSGTLFEGRYRATVVDSERYLLACLRYIELNPVRAGIVDDPAAYPWSSCRHHLGRRDDPLVTEHPLYRGLGGGPGARAYAELLAEPLDAGFLEAVRSATQSGWALGDDAFRARVAAAGRRAAPLPPGRPRKQAEVKQEMLL